MSRKNTRKRLRIFDDWKSAVHFMLGLTYTYLHHILFHVSLLILILFLSYEIFESKSKYELFYDTIEFSIGVIIGYILLVFAGAYANLHY